MQSENKLLILMFIMALVTMVYEVLGTSVLFQFYEQSSRSVALVLGIFMIGLAIGSYLSSKFNINIIYTNILAGLLGLFILSNYTKLDLIINIIPSKILVVTLFLLPLTILLGFNYPIINKMFGKNVSKVYTVDLIGATLGVVLAGLLFVPIIGIQTSLIVISLFVLATNIIFLFTNICSLAIDKKIYVTLCLFFIISLFIIPNNVSAQESEIIMPSAYGEVKVIFEDNIISKSYDTYGPGLYVDNVLMCITYSSYSEKMMAARSLKEVNGNDLDVLNIGLGCGFTSQYVLKSDRVNNLDIVEINPKVIDVNKKYFSEYNDYILEDDRTNLINEDGFIYLKNNNKKYDVILVDVQGPNVMHSTPIFTLEMFEYINNNLNDDGVFSLWIEDAEYLDSVYVTLKEVFDYVVYLEEPLSGQSYITLYASNHKLNINSSYININEDVKIRRLNNILR